MAKQAVGTLERHVEKGVLALALICLIYVIATHFLTSPNRLALSRGGESATPAVIDKLVADEADRVRNRIRESQPPPTQVPDLVPDFEDAIGMELAQLPRAVAFQPTVPTVGGKVNLPGSIELVEVVKFPKPVAMVGRSTRDIVVRPINLHTGYRDTEVSDLSRDRFPLNWVRISSVFDWAEQTRLQREAYEPGYEESLLVGIEVQRRARRPDGSWLDDDWQDLTPYVEAVLPPVGPIRITASARGPQTDLDDLDAIEDMRRLLRGKFTSLNIMRPLPARYYDGDTWDHPSNQVMIQDTEILFPKEPIDPNNLYDRYPEETPGVKEEKADKADKPEDLDPNENCREFIAERMAEFERAFAQEDLSEQNAAHNRILAIIQRSTFYDGACVDLAKRRKAEIDQKQVDWKDRIERWQRENRKRQIQVKPPLPRPRPTGTGELGPMVAGEKSPLQEVWVHDARLDSVVGGQTYQYRMRAKLFNLYAGQPKPLKNKEDATKWFIHSEWSEPSDPVYIQPETQFFVRTGSEKRGDVSVDLYKWYKGVWVGGTFKVKVGDQIGGEARTQGPDEENPTPLVDFATGVTVVDVDFHRPIRSRDKASKTGVKYVKAGETVALVLMDEAGTVFERLASIDREDPHSRTMRESLFKPKPKPKVELPQAPTSETTTGRPGESKRDRPQPPRPRPKP